MARLVRRRHERSFAFSLPTAMSLAVAWDHEFGQLAPDAARTRQLAELIPVAACFLDLFESKLQDEGRS